MYKPPLIHSDDRISHLEVIGVDGGAMRDAEHVVCSCHGDNTACFCNAAHPRDVGLDDVDRAAGEELAESVADEW